MDFFVYRHWSYLLCSCLEVWETEGLPGSQDPSLGRLQEIPSLLLSVSLPGRVLCVCITWPFLSPDLECVWYSVSYHTSHRCHTWRTTLVFEAAIIVLGAFEGMTHKTDNESSAFMVLSRRPEHTFQGIIQCWSVWFQLKSMLGHFRKRWSGGT